jgi:hypothetical protein
LGFTREYGVSGPQDSMVLMLPHRNVIVVMFEERDMNDWVNDMKMNYFVRTFRTLNVYGFSNGRMLVSRGEVSGLSARDRPHALPLLSVQPVHRACFARSVLWTFHVDFSPPKGGTK